MLLLDDFTKNGQGHVLQFTGSLDDKQQDEFIAQLKSINVSRCNAIFKKATTPTLSKTNEIEPLPSCDFDSVIDASPEKVKSWFEKGMELISQSKVGVILLAGGQGTRLGSSGCYDIGLFSHKSLFELQADRIKKIKEMAQKLTPKPVSIPWILQDKNLVSVAPDGNGGIYAALQSGGVIDDMDKRNIDFIHAYCVDNCLVKVCDPTFIGYCVEKDVQCGAKSVVKRTPEEPVGVICLAKGKYSVVEYSEIDSSLAQKMDSENKLVYRAANIANHFYTKSFLKSIPSFENELEYHVAKKKINCIDEQGNPIKPTSPNGIKLELFIFDVFPFAKKFAVLETDRKDEFSPLKNASGSKDGDSPETSKSDLIDLFNRYGNNQNMDLYWTRMMPDSINLL